jgi:hypothetical protein
MLFTEQPIYDQSPARGVRGLRENRTCGWSRQSLKMEQLSVGKTAPIGAICYA